MNLFLIGSGFTRSVFKNAPLNNELLGVISRDNPHGAAVTLADKYNTGDIEIALTKLDLEISSTTDNKDKLRGIRHEVEIELAGHFYSYTASEELLDSKPWLRDFFETIVTEGDVVVSLNYDSLFEGLLDCAGKWSPNGGYGSDSIILTPLTNNTEYKKSAVVVLKIHGSVTFTIEPNRKKSDSSGLCCIFNEWHFPVSGEDIILNPKFNKEETYLIAPSYVKVPKVEISYLMIEALKATADAKNFIIIGCGLRPEDTFLTLLLTNFLRHPDWKDRRIIIVDIKANEIAERIRRYWGVTVDQCIVPIQGELEDKYTSIARTAYEK